jgi:hypothetical protein
VGVIPSIQNINEKADYTFQFTPSRNLPAGTVLTITFPFEFVSGLGISTPSCSIGTCTVSTYDVIITTNAAIYSSEPSTCIVYGVSNPTKLGGTGPFKLKAVHNGQILAYNSAYDVIGFANKITDMTSTSALLMSGGDSTTSSKTFYDFRF